MDLPTIALEELVPYMDERPLTEEVLKELEFQKIMISETDPDQDYPVYYWSRDIPLTNMTLITNCAHEAKEGNYTAELFEHMGAPVWYTAGGIKMLLLGLSGEDKPK
jgi:hypothetical protein